MGAVGCARAMLQQGLFCPSGRRAHWGFHPPALKSPRLGFHYGVGGPVSLGFPSPGMGGGGCCFVNVHIERFEFARPVMTFVVDWALKKLSVYLEFMCFLAVY